MIRNILITGILLVALVATTACKGKYADAIEVNDQFINAVEQYTKDLDQASNSEEVVAAIDKFSESIKTLAPEMKAMAEKYPELKDSNNLPPELKESHKRAEEMSKNMASTFTKLMPYLSDPEVAAAQARMGQAMMSLGS
jgi:hypothetical protein